MISLAIFGLPFAFCLVRIGALVRRAVLASLIRFDLVWGVELKPELRGGS